MSEPEPIQNDEISDELSELDARLNELEAEPELDPAALENDEASEERSSIVPFTRLENDSNAGLLSAEWIKFFIFLLIILATLLTIRALRPLIFDQIVPSVLGLDQPRETIVLPEPSEANTLAPANDTEENQAANGSETGSDQTGSETGNTAGTGSNGEVEEAQNVPAANINRGQTEQPTENPGFQIEHVVQPGETLISIGEKYDVSPVVLATANNLPNPNQIQVGATIIIPAGEISGK